MAFHHPAQVTQEQGRAIVFFLFVLGAILVAAKGSALAPFIYSLF